jgi:hypothetical protein
MNRPIHTKRQEWFQAYIAAMLESDENTVEARVQNAERAIHERIAGMNVAQATDDRELTDLKYAMRHLQLLSTLSSAERVRS